jgi:multidrug transporter EmrE-like cation transporter
MSYLLLLTSVGLTAFSHVMLRYGMTREPVVEALSGASISAVFMELVKSPPIIAGFSLYAVSVVLWLLVLAKLPVSIAYPFVALGIVLTTAFGVVFLREAIPALSAMGILLVVVGVLLLAAGRAAA